MKKELETEILKKQLDYDQKNKHPQYLHSKLEHPGNCFIVKLIESMKSRDHGFFGTTDVQNKITKIIKILSKLVTIAVRNSEHS